MSELTNEQTADILAGMAAVNESDRQYEALRKAEAALRGMGEPVAWMTLGALTAQPVFTTTPPDEPNVAGWSPLYAPRRGEE